ncbi:MAG: hypothetical protein HZC10_03190 [Nitrospirae bacterium]|nr:hypothetical protein [Nitrospirota bacterium]
MQKYNIDEIFKGVETKHSLGLFDKRLISSIILYDKNDKPYLKCFGSDKERPAKPEEIVRQLFIKKLLEEAKRKVEEMIEKE